MKPIGVRRRERPRLVQETLRDERPAAADVRREAHAPSSGLEHVCSRHSDLGMTVVGERVVEENDGVVCGTLRSANC